MTDTHEIRVSARTAQLRASDSDDEDGPPWRFSGVAVAAGDILHMDDGTPVLFTEEELRAAAETQTGEPLTVDHPSDEDGRPQYPPPTDETVGRVPKAGFVDDVDGLAYEATTHDETIANGVQAGSYEVSVHPTFELGAKDAETGAYKAKNVRFRDLSVVSKGDSPSNTVKWGPNQALASFTRSTDIGEELTAADEAVADANSDGGFRALVERLAERVGVLDSTDMRGGVRFVDQTTGGDTVTIDAAGFEDAPWLVTLHASGEEFPDVADGLGPALGVSAPQEPGDAASIDVELDDPLGEDQTLFALLRYHADGEVSDPIPTSDGGYYLDSAFVGVAPDGVDVEDAAEATASASGGEWSPSDGAGHIPTEEGGSERRGNEGAESSLEAEAATSPTMDDNTRDKYVSFLTANGFDEESARAMDDDVLQSTYELAAEATDADGGDPGSTDTDDTTIGDMTVDELGDALREQGFVTEDQADDLVEEATAQAEKEEKVEEIVAKSDEYDEDDREDLMASADTLVDREFQRVRGELAASTPAHAGGAQLTGGASDGDAPSDYGTGVKEEN